MTNLEEKRERILKELEQINAEIEKEQRFEPGWYQVEKLEGCFTVIEVEKYDRLLGCESYYGSLTKTTPEEASVRLLEQMTKGKRSET